MCSLCQSTLKEKERRELHSDSTEHVLPTLLEFSGKVRRGYSDGGVIPTAALISPAYCGVRQSLLVSV